MLLTQFMLNQTQIQKIKPHMPVVCSENGQFATVDHLDGADSIKLSKDANGQHHFIPMSWVTSVDSKVHIDRPGDKAMKQWSTEPLVGGKLDSAQDKNRANVNYDSSTANKPMNAQRQQTNRQEFDSNVANKPVNTQRQQGPQTQRQALPNNPKPETGNRNGGQLKNESRNENSRLKMTAHSV